MQICVGQRGVLAGIVTVLICCLTAATSSAFADDGRHAALVIDANTGRVLHSDDADEARFPASLTKMMTLYMVFELIEAGKLNNNTPIRVSAQASAVAPSKLDLDPGDTIPLGAAIRALVTKSANDVAVAIAEHVSGTEAAFARAMTAKARQLGMRSTVFRNAHGLPDSEQVTTARDIATLSLALYDHFPEHARVFATRRFTYAGSSYRNHNTLLGSFEGMEGIKTGYTRASGFNLAASVRHHGRHVVAVVLGGRTSAARNAEMRVLLKRGLARASTNKTRRPMLIARSEPSRPAPVRHAQAEPSTPRLVEQPRLASPPRTANPPIQMARVRPVSVVAAPAAASARMTDDSDPRFHQPALPAYAPQRPAEQPRVAYAIPDDGRGARPSTFAAQAQRLQQGQPAVIAFNDTTHQQPSYVGATSRPIETHALPSARRGGDYAVQVGAFATAAEAEARLRDIRQSAGRVLATAAEQTEPTTQGSRTLYRARFADLESGAAAEACNVLRRQRIDCFVARLR
jgi:D-alanyl-D-alanine carboxypeptidase